jgi:Ssp1 endopeptidase immunity protein Rap1a
MIRLVPVAATCLLTTFAHAAAPPTYSGNEWLDYCNSGQAGQILCLTYARAVADTIQLWSRLAPHTAPACIPQEVTTGQLKEIGQRFMMVNAKDRHYEAAQLLTAAFKQAWPCPTPRTR